MNKIIIILLVITSCNSQKKAKEESTSIVNETYKKAEEKQVNSKEIKTVDSISKKEIEPVKFLKKAGVINKSYVFTEEISYKTYNNINYQVNLLVLSYEESLGSLFLEDPVVNIFYIREKENLLDYRIIYTIDDEDFKFSFKKGEIYFFEYYDSSTGWKKTIFYNKSFYQTHRYDESDNIDIESIDLKNGTYKLKNKNEVFKFEEIKK
ncbi:hypothetical protein [Tenacibaculum sp.]|uniref:hypothetical protein n=1 Tax=Tenacibaculum sp. TaxID=1906242 RepID=UPI003AA82587